MSPTTFVFMEHWTETGCLSLVLDEYNALKEPLLERSFDELKAIQINTKTIVLLPTKCSTITRVSLPWLTEKKARVALAYGVEDAITDSLSDVHIAYDKSHYQDGAYLTVIIKKSTLQESLSALQAAHIAFDAITIDWFALLPEETYVLSDALLVYQTDYMGVLAETFLPFYYQDLPPNQLCYAFPNALNTSLITAPIEEPFPLWAAKRLYKKPFINLCQGDFQTETTGINTIQWLKIAGVMVGLWLIATLLVDIIKIHQLNKALDHTDKKITQIYKQFFPNASQVISPRFRIEQALKTQKNGNEDLWALLNKLNTVILKKATTIQQIKYQNHSLQVSLVSNNFEALEQLQEALQKTGIQVKQRQATTEGETVHSVLELTL